MVSDFMKQINAERIARSQFKAGGHVAIVSHHWDRRIVGKRKIAKVHANGNFTIEDRNCVAQPQQYRPDSDGTTARPAGEARYVSRSEHLEPWTDAIEDEIKQRRIYRALEQRRDALIEKLKAQRGTDLALNHAWLDAAEQALGLAAPIEPEHSGDSE